MRPTRLTPKLMESLLELVQVGVGLDVAADHEGVGRTSVWAWQRKGRDVLRRIEAGEVLEPTKNEKRYADFAKGVARARASFEVSILRRLQTLDEAEQVLDPVTEELVTVNKIDPKVAAALTKSLTWLLETKRREEYGSQITVKVEEAKTYLLDIVESVCDRLGAQEVLEAILDELERGGASAEGGEEILEAVH